MKPTKRLKKRKALMAVGLAMMAASVVALCAQPATGPAQAPPTLPRPAAAPPDARVTSEGWFAPIRRSATPPVLPKEVNTTFIIPIKGPISNTTYETIKRKAQHARGKGAQLVIFDISTPGGESTAMGKIVRLILDDLADQYTVAYVHPRAVSAGAIISLACDEIVMTPTGVIGDAMPILVGPQGLTEIPKKIRGKFESYARSEVRVLAKRNGYNVSLCEAMVTITMEMWLIRHRQTEELRIVEAREWRGRVAGVPPKTTTSPAAPEQADWQYVRMLDGPMELVTLTADEAIFVGLVRNVFANMDELKTHYGVVEEPVALIDSWSEDLVGFLTSPALAGLLMFLGVLCIYIELNTPGFGVAGTVAIVCFAILFGSRFLVGMAAWWEIALFFVGLILITVEVFVTPGFGVLGITGILCCVASLLAILVSNPPDKLPIPETDIDWNLFTNGLFALMVGFLGACFCAILIARFLPKTPVGGRLILKTREVPHVSPAAESATIHKVQVGDTGTVEGPCRPVGHVRFDSGLADAIADGQFLPAGAKVRATRIEGNRVVVTHIA